MKGNTTIKGNMAMGTIRRKNTIRRWEATQRLKTMGGRRQYGGRMRYSGGRQYGDKKHRAYTEARNERKKISGNGRSCGVQRSGKIVVEGRRYGGRGKGVYAQGVNHVLV